MNINSTVLSSDGRHEGRRGVSSELNGFPGSVARMKMTGWKMVLRVAVHTDGNKGRDGQNNRSAKMAELAVIKMLCVLERLHMNSM